MKRLQKVLLGVCSAVFCLSAVALIGQNTETVSASADTVSTWEMVDGASVRTSDPAGIRFSAKISEADYTTLTANGADVSFGMVIMPYSYVAEYGDADTVFDADTKYTFSESDTTKVRVLHDSVSELTTKKNGYYYFNAALTNIAESNYEKEFYARAYYSDGTNYYFTPDNGTDNVRSVSYVAQKALEDHYNAATTTQYSASAMAMITEYVTQFETVADGNVTLAVADAADVTSIAVDGTVVTPTATSGNTITLATTIGRHTATITTPKASYDIPFVSATYVVDSAAALKDMCNHMTNNAASTSKNEYIVLAKDIDWKNENGTNSYNFQPSVTIAAWSGTFDGYGHTISNITIYKVYGLLATTFYGKAMDLVMKNVDAAFSGTGGVLCGTLGHASNKNETTYRNTVENVVIIGKNSNASNAGLIARQINAKGVVKNCIVVDTSNMNGTTENTNRSAIGGVPDGKTATITNSIAVTTGVAVINVGTKAEITTTYDVTKVASEADITADMLSAFATAAGENSSWNYNAKTGELSLMGNVVFTVSLNNNL